MTIQEIVDFLDELYDKEPAGELADKLRNAAASLIDLQTQLDNLEVAVSNLQDLIPEN